MKRREFLEKVGVGSVGLASLSSVLLGSARHAHAGKPEERHSTFVAQSDAPAVGLVVPRAAMEGRVEFRPNKGKVDGGGSWVIFDNAAPVPKPILGGGTLFGTWEAEEFVTFIDGFGTFGRIEASILELLIKLQPDGSDTDLDGTLRLICNIGAAGISTGEPEGYRLTIPSLGLGTFNPLVPAVGLTHISVPED